MLVIGDISVIAYLVVKSIRVSRVTSSKTIKKAVWIDTVDRRHCTVLYCTYLVKFVLQLWNQTAYSAPVLGIPLTAYQISLRDCPTSPCPYQ